MRTKWIAIVVILIVIVSALLFSKQGCRSSDQMNKRFEILFEESLRVTGERYRDVRAEIIGLEAIQVVSLIDLRKDPNWRVSLQAAIFSDWRDQKERYEYIRRVAHGTDPSLEPNKFMTGKPPVGVPADVLIEMGSDCAPALLEMVYKEWDIVTQYAFFVCNEVLAEWEVPWTIPAYRALLVDFQVPQDFRDLSMRPLVELGAENLFEDLNRIYINSNEHHELRLAALATMGELIDSRAVPFLQDIFTDPAEALDFRCATATGLGESHNVKVINVLAEEYKRTNELELRKAIIFALGSLEVSQVIVILERLKEIEKDKGLLELIDNTLRDLEYLKE